MSDYVHIPFFHQVTWDGVLPQLRTDPRFINSPLPLNQQLHLFHSHVATLRSKHLASLHALFDSHSPSLATPFTALPVESLISSLPVTKLGFDVERLEQEYDKWQRERTHEARLAFDQMLAENAFVEFWGRLGKIGGKGVDEGIKVDDLGEDADEEQVDMKALAKNVDLKEMVKVLKVRFPAFAPSASDADDDINRMTNGISCSTMSRNSERGGSGYVCQRKHLCGSILTVVAGLSITTTSI